MSLSSRVYQLADSDLCLILTLKGNDPVGAAIFGSDMKGRDFRLIGVEHKKTNEFTLHLPSGNHVLASWPNAPVEPGVEVGRVVLKGWSLEKTTLYLRIAYKALGGPVGANFEYSGIMGRVA